MTSWFVLFGCNPGPTELATLDGPTWWQDVQPIVEARCGSCHQPGDIAPVPLTTYEEVVAIAPAVQLAIESNTMPPWPPADGCNTYAGDRSLPDAELQTLLAWLDTGLAEGDPTDPADPIELPAADLVADVVVTLPEPYTPGAPDDYRCQVVEWPVAEATHVVGLRVVPDQRQMVHHTIVFAATAETAQTFRDLDEAEAGPGYTCFGGPTGGAGEDGSFGSLNPDEFGLGGTSWIGSWVPGARGGMFPAGTGIPIEPGSVLIVQMHYNTSATPPVPDQSTVEIATALEVTREALILPFTDLGWLTGSELLGGPMTIPAGQAAVEHETSTSGAGIIPSFGRVQLGIPLDAPLTVYTVGHHMHQLGASGYQQISHPDGSTTCLIDIPQWDFHWQGGYRLATPATLAPDDMLSLRCTWDNSAENQPLVDGTRPPPQDVEWGEGTSDEMCLSTLYVTGP